MCVTGGYLLAELAPASGETLGFGLDGARHHVHVRQLFG